MNTVTSLQTVQCNLRLQCKGQTTGENLGAAATGDDYREWNINHILTRIKSWYDESVDYVWNATALPGKDVSHWTQGVWAKTRYVGCGYAVCEGDTNPFNASCVAHWLMVVCKYFPSKITEQVPYTNGSKCSDCDRDRSDCTGNDEGLCGGDMCLDCAADYYQEKTCAYNATTCPSEISMAITASPTDVDVPAPIPDPSLTDSPTPFPFGQVPWDPSLNIYDAESLICNDTYFGTIYFNDELGPNRTFRVTPYEVRDDRRLSAHDNQSLTVVFSTCGNETNFISGLTLYDANDDLRVLGTAQGGCPDSSDSGCSGPHCGTYLEITNLDPFREYYLKISGSSRDISQKCGQFLLKIECDLEWTCESHCDCPYDRPFCWDMDYYHPSHEYGICTDCSTCTDCATGIDGTCGMCGSEYLRNPVEDVCTFDGCATTLDPTIDPTMNPTNEPSTDPTEDPSPDPSTDPTTKPTSDPTIDPTSDPTTVPTPGPSYRSLGCGQITGRSLSGLFRAAYIHSVLH